MPGQPVPPAGGFRPAPKWARKRFVLPALGVAFLLGGVITSAGDTTTQADAKPAAAGPGSSPRPTVTVTEAATSSAEPAPTVTRTVKATTTVRATVTAAAQGGGAAAGDDSSDGGSGGGSVYYANCSEARAAGAAPVHRGEPGYASHLDRDGDGIGCDT
ncbi:excalibur calcium-binding domain-containing protein [Streptomyces xanthii]|uniref:Excalibur calcium-binding domain-containing protein n=2 Tax=Streptomyces xanthii TaxID=2768069 RepID=A0A7H1BID8_9ACTN|nr:excalibur calcium-binding domain-containing protein [Streptomyces xanthii]QNS08493.1 excalibur calcium-binding domain-containing protein [Streptomyces xanthii]